MKIHFEPNQAYQIEAIKSVVDIFEGQPSLVPKTVPHF